MRLALVTALAFSLIGSTAQAANWASPSAQGTFTGVSKSRVKSTRLQLFGKSSATRVETTIARDGDKLTMTQTAPDALGTGKPLSTILTGKILHTETRRNGDVVMKVEQSGEANRQAAATAMQATLKDQRMKIDVPIAAMRSISTMVFHADGSLSTKGKSVITRGRITTDSPAADAMLNLLLRNEWKSKHTAAYEAK